MIMVLRALELLAWAIQMYIYVMLAMCAFSMLASFNVLDTRNRLVGSIGEFLYRVTDPVLRPVRGLLPQAGMIDISPMIVVLLLSLVVLPLLARCESALMLGNW